MKVGVAIPVYNEIDAIERCLASIGDQTYPDVGAYIALDRPTDGTDKLLAAHPDRYRRKRMLRKRSGWPSALNAAVALAIDDGCEAVLTMDADNYVREDAVEKLAAALDGHDWAVSYGQQVGGTDTLQTPLAKFPLTLADFDGPHAAIAGGFAMVRAPIWAEVGGFATDISLPGSYGYNEDWDFWIRVLKAGYGNGALVREPLLFYVMSDKQLHKESLHRHAEARALIMTKHPDVFHPEQWTPCGCGCMSS